MRWSARRLASSTARSARSGGRARARATSVSKMADGLRGLRGGGCAGLRGAQEGRRSRSR